MVINAILGTLKTIAGALLTEAVLKRLVVWGIKRLAEYSDNTVDDELADMVEKAVYKPEEFEKEKEDKKEEEQK